MTTQPLKPFFGYFGSKYRVAPLYHRAEYSTIVEPFGGAAGYSLLYPDRQVVLCDANPVVTRLWRYLISVDPAEILALPDDLEDGLTPVQRDLIGFWYGKGLAVPRRTRSPWASRTDTACWGPEIRQRIASQVGRIRHWVVIEGDYTALPDLTGTWFVDSPYSGRWGDYYPKGRKGIDFARLAEWCRSRKGQVIVCESEGATWLPFKHFRGGMRSTSKLKGRAPGEVVWYSDTG